MKKFITAAALFAASTALASAATVISWEDLRACDATFFNSSQTTVGETLTLTATERVQFDVSSLNIDFASEQYVFTLTVSDLLVGNGPFITWGVQTGQVTGAQYYGFGASGNNNNCWAATINGSSMSQRYSGSMSYDVTGLNGANSLSGTFTLTIGSGTLDVVFVDSENTSYTLTPTGGLSMERFSYGTSIQSITLGGWATTSSNGTSMTISTIPEPSAFGLLAGVGALALVAARRRRFRAK